MKLVYIVQVIAGDQKSRDMLVTKFLVSKERAMIIKNELNAYFDKFRYLTDIQPYPTLKDVYLPHPSEVKHYKDRFDIDINFNLSEHYHEWIKAEFSGPFEIDESE